MSYTKPTMYQQADPLAFSKGFDAAFQKQQDAFKADLEERERIAKEADEALAFAYSAADIGPINGIDAKFNDALQAGLNSIVERGDFANASASEKAKMLQQLKLKKSAFQRIGEIMGVDQEDWDLRNDPKLSAFRAAVLKGDPSIQVEANGLDFKIKGNFGEITLDDISNKRIINKAPYEEALNEVNGSFAETYQKSIYEAFKSGKTDQEIQLLREDFKKTYADRIKGLDPDMKEYLKYNVAKTNDEGQMIDTMFDKFDSQIKDPGLIYNRPQKEPDFTSGFASDLGNRVSLDPASFFNRLGTSAGYQGVQLNKDNTISFQRPVQDADGNVVMQQGSIDLNNPADFEAYARSVFNQFGGSEIGVANRTQAYSAFRQSLQESLTKQAASQPQQPQTETTTNQPAQVDAPEQIKSALQASGIQVTQEAADELQQAIKEGVGGRGASINEVAQALKKQKDDNLRKQNQVPGSFVKPGGDIIKFDMQEGPRPRTLTSKQKKFFKDNNIPPTFENVEKFNELVADNSIDKLTILDRRKQFEQNKIQ